MRRFSSLIAWLVVATLAPLAALGQVTSPPTISQVRGAALEVDVALYGASPTASASINTMAFNTALTNFRRVRVTRPGTYQISSSLLFQSDRALIGPGNDSVIIKLANNSRTYMLKNNTWAVGSSNPISGRQSNILIEGLTFDGNKANNTAVGPYPNWYGFGATFRGVDGLTIRNCRFNDNTSYSVWIMDGTRTLLERLHFTNQTKDGIHFAGPMDGVTVRDITGSTDDDFVAFAGVEWVVNDASRGDIKNVLVENIYGTTKGHLVRFWSAIGYVIRNVTVRNVKGSAGDATNANNGVGIEDPTYTDGTAFNALPGPTDIDGVLVEDVKVSLTQGATAAVRISAGAAKTITLKDIVGVTTNTRLLTVEAIANIKTLNLLNFASADLTTAAPLCNLASGGVVDTLRMSNWSIRATNTTAFQNQGTISRAIITNCFYECTGSSNSPAFFKHTSGTTINVQASTININSVGSTFGFAVVNTATPMATMNLRISNYVTTGGFSRFQTNGSFATMNVTGSGYSTDEAITLNRISNPSNLGFLRLNYPEFYMTPTNASLTVRVDGDRIFNNVTTYTNTAGMQFREGVLEYNGLEYQRPGPKTYWKSATLDPPNLASGASHTGTVTFVAGTDLPASSSTNQWDRALVITPTDLPIGIIVIVRHLGGSGGNFSIRYDMLNINAVGAPDVNVASSTFYFGIQRP